MTAPDPDRPAPLRRALRIALKGLAGLVGVLFLAAVAMIGALQFDAVGTRVARAVGDRVVPDGLEFSVGTVSGSWLTSLRMVDVALTGPEGSEVARVDTLAVRYNLLSLISRRVQLKDVDAVGVYASLVRRSDGAIGLSGTSPSPPRAATTGSNPWAITLGSLRVDGAAGQLTTPQSHGNAASDSAATTVTWSELQLAMRDVALGEDLSFVVDSATVRVDVPTLPPESAVGPLDIRVIGRLAEGRLGLDTLEITAPDGRVDGAGDLVLPGFGRPPGVGGSPGALDLHLAPRICRWPPSTPFWATRPPPTPA